MAPPSAFPYSIPYTNPYTQRKTQPTSFASSQSSKEKLEQALNVLVRSHNVPSKQNIEHLCGLVEHANDSASSSQNRQQQSSCWSRSMAESLAKFVVQIFAPPRQEAVATNSEGYPSTLTFLAHCLDQWSQDDSIIYAAVVKEFEVEIDQQRIVHISLLDTLHNLSVNSRDPIIQNPAMMGLSVIWRYLDRIQFLTLLKSPGEFPAASIESAWWINDEEALANKALNELLSDHREDNAPKTYLFPGLDELKLSWVSTLVDLLKHDRTSWLHQFASQEKDSVQKMSQILLAPIHKLTDPGTMSRSSLHYSIACASLLCLMNKEALEEASVIDQAINSSKLLDSAFRTAFGMFGASSPSGPRWSLEHRDCGTLRWMEQFIFIWSLCQDGENRYFALENLQRHWQPHIEQCWRSLLTDDYSTPYDTQRNLKHSKELLSRLVLMYSIHHNSLRSSLLAMIGQLANYERGSSDCLVQPCKALLNSLKHLIFDPDPSISLCAASLMKSLLSERGCVFTHDDIFVKAQDSTTIQTILQSVVEHLSTADDELVHRPHLLSMLDILDLAFAWKPSLKSATELVDAHTVEILIHVMTPKDIRIDQAGAFLRTSQNTSIMEDLDCDTPPANNLSRLDERSICIEKEEEQKATTGIDHSIRLAAATVLARFGYTSIDNLRKLDDQDGTATTTTTRESEKGLLLIQSRIRSAVTDFFSSSTPGHESSDKSLTSLSMELTKRRFRLQTSMAASPENEEYLSSYLFAKEKYHANAVRALQEKIELLQQKLEKAAENEAQMIKEKDENRKKIDAQSVRFWREAQRLKKTKTEQIKSKVAQFDADRKIAERRALALSNQVKDAEARVSEADRAVKTSNEAELRLRMELDAATKKAHALEKANQELSLHREQKDAEASEMKETLGNLQEHQGKLKRALADKDGEIADLQEARDNMESNLDCLFADLVKLSNMYEVQEANTEKLRARNDKLSAELQHEQKQKESERTLSAENNRLESEKAKLETKLAKYRQKIEALRREREQREQKQRNRAPVSYINSLHDSMNASSTHTASKHGRSSTSQKKAASSKEHYSRGKENGYPSSGSLHHRSSRTRDDHSSSSHIRSRSYRS